MMPTVKPVPGDRLFLGFRIALFFLIAAGFALPPSALAQVAYTGSTAAQNFGSQAIGSTSAAQTFNFSIAAGTMVGSIGLVTQGAPNLDFTEATGGTCTATTYASITTCTVKVTFTPKAAGVRMGAVVFFSEAGNTGTVLGSVLVGGNATGPQISFGPVAEFAISNAVCEPAGGDPSLCLYPPEQAYAVAVDGAGDLFFSDPAFNVVYEVPASGLTSQNSGPFIQISSTVNGTGLNNPCGLAVDGAGDLWIGDAGNNRVMDVPAGGGAATAIAPTADGTGLNGPCGLAFDAAGDLFISDGGNNRVVEVPAGGGAATAIDPTVNGQALSSPNYVAVDGAGDLFISDNGNNRVVEIPASGGAATAIDPTVNGGGLNGPMGVAVDGAGNLYIGDSGNGHVVEVPTGGAPFAVVNLNVTLPIGVAVDGAGDLFVGDAQNSLVNPDWVWVAQRARPQPLVLNFPTVTGIGSIDTTDGTQTVQLQNIGNEALALTLSYPADFSEGTGVSNACPVSTSLSASQACDVAVEFAPQNVGVLRESVTLTDNAPNAGSKQLISVSGASAPAAYATHFSITTTASVVAGDPFSLTLTGLNSANEIATGYNGTVIFTSSDPGFVNPGALTLSSGVGHATVTMGTAGTQTIRATDSALSYVTSTASFAVAPAPLGMAIYTGAAATQNFGSRAIGTTSEVRTLSFNVLGGAAVGSIGAVVLGDANLDFDIAAGGNCAVQHYTSPTTCTVNVTFTPNSPGLRRGALAFFSGPNDTGTVLGGALLYGIGTGPEIAYGYSDAYLITETQTGTDGQILFGALAADGAGDVFVAYQYCLLELPTGGGNAGCIGPGGVVALAIDGAGRLYQVDPGNNFVNGPNGSVAPTVDGKALNGPAGLALDGEGDLFIADGGNNRIVEVPAGGGAATAISPTVNGEGLNGPSGLALDSAGDLFIADTNNGRVVEVPAGGGAATVIISGLGDLTGVAVDAAGDLFIADFYITEVPAGGGAPVIFIDGIFGPMAGVAVDGSGDVFASYNQNTYVYGYPMFSEVVEAKLSLQAPPLNFPTATAVGSTDTTDGTQTVQIENMGNEPLTLTALSYPSDFPEATGDANACTGSTSLSAGQECDLPIEFAPENSGVLSEAVTLTDNALNVTGAQQSIRVTGTGVGVQAAMVSPSPGSTLTGTGATFVWTAGGGVTSYDLWIGTSGVGSSNLYISNPVTATSASTSNLPAKGVVLYVRLFSKIGGLWLHTDYTYTEATAVLATLTSPTAGSTLAPSNVAFTWTPGLGVVSYNLWLGVSGVGSSDLYNSGIVTTTSTTVPALPAKGATVYARLFSNVGGEWEWTDSTYVESTAVLATITSPTPGATLGTSNISFTWTAGLGVQKYNLWLGISGVGSSDLYNSGIVTATSATVPTMPAKGAMVYARLFSDVGGAWMFTDFTYVEQ
jgi:sugar lactone lactonase YvrE